MSETAHTPGPWIAVPYLSPKGKALIKSLDGKTITSGPMLTDDDAAFIVRACNAHDDMLAALRSIAGTLDLESFPTKGCMENRLGSLARAAIAKAEGRS